MTVHDVVHSFVENVVQAMAEVRLPVPLLDVEAATPLPDVQAGLSQATSNVCQQHHVNHIVPSFFEFLDS